MNPQTCFFNPEKLHTANPARFIKRQQQSPRNNKMRKPSSSQDFPTNDAIETRRLSPRNKSRIESLEQLAYHPARSTNTPYNLRRKTQDEAATAGQLNMRNRKLNSPTVKPAKRAKIKGGDSLEAPTSVLKGFHDQPKFPGRMTTKCMIWRSDQRRHATRNDIGRICREQYEYPNSA
jgi:hypothetical protein